MGGEWRDKPRSPMDTGRSGSADRKIIAIIGLIGAGALTTVLSVAAFLAHGYGLV